jgi:ubiquinone/menaquinone biosynthesis C-methylase UbiE
LEKNVFDKNLFDYDNVIDLYYSWFYSRLHYFICKYVIKKYNPPQVLDIGCGSGFQSYLYSLAGSFVVGIDISSHLISLAQKKLKTFYNSDQYLFPEKYSFVKNYNKLINRSFKKKYKPPNFIISDMKYIPFSNNSFPHINCCGSVLNLSENKSHILKEMSRVLKPNGTMFVEIESRWSLDRFWTIIDLLLRNKLGFRTSFKDVIRSIFSNPTNQISIIYPYGEYNDPIPMKLNLFTKSDLIKDFFGCNLRILKRWTIHSITNIIPSTILDTNYPSNRLTNIFKCLAYLEEKINLPLPGCSIAFLLQKNDT